MEATKGRGWVTQGPLLLGGGAQIPTQDSLALSCICVLNTLSVKLAPLPGFVPWPAPGPSCPVAAWVGLVYTFSPPSVLLGRKERREGGKKEGSVSFSPHPLMCNIHNTSLKVYSLLNTLIGISQGWRENITSSSNFSVLLLSQCCATSDLFWFLSPHISFTCSSTSYELNPAVLLAVSSVRHFHVAVVTYCHRCIIFHGTNTIQFIQSSVVDMRVVSRLELQFFLRSRGWL